MISRAGGQQGRNSQQVDGPAQIAGQDRKADLAPDILQATYQKIAMAHPVLECAEVKFTSFQADGLIRWACPTDLSKQQHLRAPGKNCFGFSALCRAELINP